MGGIHVLETDLSTPLKGVFAAGEVANVSLHGVNKLGSNSLPACLVMGKWAGRSAFTYLESETEPTTDRLNEIIEKEVERPISHQEGEGIPHSL
jgi:succinate dehydrogenase/fumarate reductase flavoprotein subunit